MERATTKSKDIQIVGAREHNLKNVTVSIPKHRLTVFTGLSGSGKSSLVFDTIAAESQRQLNETFPSFVQNRLPHYGQPDVDELRNLTFAVIVDQKRIGGNARSTVGTVTDIYTQLRLLFSRIGKPYVGEAKLFSFNNPDAMCLRCQGLGKVRDINLSNLLDKTKSLSEGAVLFPTFYPGGARWKRYALSGLFDNDKKLEDYTKEEMDTLLYKTDVPIKHPLPGWWASTKYIGLIPRLRESFVDAETREAKNRYPEEISKIVTEKVCPICNGGRLNKQALASKVHGRNIAECANLEINDLAEFMKNVDEPIAATIAKGMRERLESMKSIGLGYLSLSRETTTLSGGESQRVKMVKHLGSSLTDVTYIFDEPSVGLHPSNVTQMIELLKKLRDKGNTILVVEHDPDVMKMADHIIDMGPEAGSKGGKVVFTGSFSSLQKSDTITGKSLRKRLMIKQAPLRISRESFTLKHITYNNLRDISVHIPKDVITAITGVAGSGKSSLVSGALPEKYPDAIIIDQTAVHASKRSNPLTYLGIFDDIRETFGRINKVSASLFSFNSEGACPHCKGLGYVTTDLAFMDPIQTVCEVCHGKQFTEKVLGYTLKGKNIHDILTMTVADATLFFEKVEESKVRKALQSLLDVGVGYLTLGQPLSTLSGGEAQRIKLASHLQNDESGRLYVMDEPTTGLHMADIERLLLVMNRLVDAGNSLIVIEHNTDVISQADWVIELGPGPGREGGKITFEGTPQRLRTTKNTATGPYLK